MVAIVMKDQCVFLVFFICVVIIKFSYDFCLLLIFDRHFDDFILINNRFGFLIKRVWRVGIGQLVMVIRHIGHLMIQFLIPYNPDQQKGSDNYIYRRKKPLFAE